MPTTMAAEWAPHTRTWMAFPTTTYGSAITVEAAQAAWTEVAAAISDFEPVTMVVDPRHLAAAERLLPAAVAVVTAELDDAWARDTGPTFVSDAQGQQVALDWRFNGWGAQGWAQSGADDALARQIADVAQVPAQRVELVNEGGGIEVDGSGRLVLTETVQLDPGRNPGRSRGEVEAIFAEVLGIDDVLWLPRGLTGDYAEFGTRGHVDLCLKFSGPSRALLHRQANPTHPDFAVSEQLRASAEAAGIEVTELVAPARLEVEGRLCDYSYVNCYVCNGAVIVGTYDDPADEAALATIAAAFPGRAVVPVDARVLFALGGGVHCITQQQPAGGGPHA